jgi:hypothetical protein
MFLSPPAILFTEGSGSSRELEKIILAHYHRHTAHYSSNITTAIK